MTMLAQYAFFSWSTPSKGLVSEGRHTVFAILKITYEIEPGMFDEKRGNTVLLIKHSGF